MPVQSTSESFVEDWIFQTYDYAGIRVRLARRVWYASSLSAQRWRWTLSWQTPDCCSKICPGKRGSARLHKHCLSESTRLVRGKDSMAKNGADRHLAAHYDAEQDILYLLFTPQAQEAIAEEVSDGVFVRFDPKTRRVINIEFLDFSARVDDVFGPDMTYLGSERPERVLLPLGQSPTE